MEVATENLQVTKENLNLTCQRYEAGVTDNVEVVQSQESVAGADLDYTDSVFAHNVAKLAWPVRRGKRQTTWHCFCRPGSNKPFQCKATTGEMIGGWAIRSPLDSISN